MPLIGLLAVLADDVAAQVGLVVEQLPADGTSKTFGRTKSIRSGDHIRKKI